jgi:mannose-6-phosphate isomerase-like protein (cupin superfamily)
MRWEITRSTEDTSGELFESTNWLDPRMPAPPRHVHPNEESFEVLEGSLEVWKDGKWTTVRPGETATAPAGTAHTFRNASNEPATIITRFRPAFRSEAYFRDMHKLIQEGKIKRLPPKEPRSAIYASMLISEYSDEWRDRPPERRHEGDGARRQGASIRALARPPFPFARPLHRAPARVLAYCRHAHGQRAEDARNFTSARVLK